MNPYVFPARRGCAPTSDMTFEDCQVVPVSVEKLFPVVCKVVHLWVLSLQLPCLAQWKHSVLLLTLATKELHSGRDLDSGHWFCAVFH